MIIQIGFFIFLCTLSYSLYICLPEIKIFLKKDRKKQNINNINIPKSLFQSSREDYTKSYIHENPEPQSYPPNDRKEVTVEEKMKDIFLNPKLKDIKTNFKDLGDIKNTNKNINDDVIKLKEMKKNANK